MISDQRYKLVVEGANDGIWDWDLENNTYFFSLKYKKTFGYNADELDNTFDTWRSLFHPDDFKKALEKVEEYLKSKKGVYKNTYRIRCKDGSYRWVLSRGKAVWDSSGSAIRIAGSHTDITDQMNLQENLRQEKELSESVIRDASVIIFVWDKNKTIRNFNPFAEKVTGYKREDVIGKNGINLLVSEKQKDLMNEIFNKIINGDQFEKSELEIDIISKTGNRVTILWKNNLLHDQDGNVQGVVSIGMDITERINLEKKLHTMAYYDPLTQLPNRTMLQEKVDNIIKARKDQKSKIAFIYIDIDNFKHINDTLGHAVGDKLLIYISNILSYNIKEPNIVSRLGGDEFGIILTDINNIDDINNEIYNILKLIRRPWTLEKHEFFISTSMGVAMYPDHGENLATLMQNADTAMSNIKEKGKDGFKIYSEDMLETTWKYIQMSNELRYAINNNQFLLYYQPQIDLNTNKIIGVEALIRWKHPEKGFISPMEFIPFAEKTGYINEIGDWVFKTACDQKRRWNTQGNLDIKISINLSSKMLVQKDLVSNIERVLNECNMKCCDIELEITETAIMADLEKAVEVLNNLKKLNLTIALDDFGTGYSSLTYLQKLPIDVLKVDREFIKDIVDDDDESYILKSIIDLAHNLGLKVVAEGVESKTQLDYIRNKGCDIVQGYYFSKPVSVTDMDKLLKKKYIY